MKYLQQIVFLCISFGLCVQGYSKPKQRQSIPSDDQRRQDAKQVALAGVSGKTKLAVASAVVLGTGAIGLFSAAACLHKKNQKQQAVLKKHLSAIRDDAGEEHFDTRAVRKRRALVRWLVVSGLVCLAGGAGLAIPMVQAQQNLWNAKQILMAPIE